MIPTNDCQTPKFIINEGLKTPIKYKTLDI